MRKQNCLYCYQPLLESERDFHAACCKKFFGTEEPPTLALNEEKLKELANSIVLRSVAVTGVQPKLSLSIEKEPGDPKKSRFTIVGLWGQYILKPPTPEFPFLPENEDLTMHLASLCGITTADHSLLRLESGDLAYITKRFDRLGQNKLALEDMAQLTETLTSDKYRSSMEKIGKCIWSFASSPGLAAVAFFERVVFSFLTGNADMHLKNFALLTQANQEVVLAPAYDMLCTILAIPDDKEESALTINGKRNRLTKRDFDLLAANLKIPERSIANVYAGFGTRFTELEKCIQSSFLPDDIKAQYLNTVHKNYRRLGLLK
jgi:serine/threonine-protein kinase HipA